MGPVLPASHLPTNVGYGSGARRGADRIQDLLGARRPPPGRENVGRRVTGRRWWPILPSGGRTEVGTNQVIGSRIQDRPAPRSGITECRGPSRASTWGSFCLRFAALRPPPVVGGGHGSSGRMLRRPRRPPGVGGRVRPPRRGGTQAAQGGPDLRHGDGGPGRPARLAGGPRRDPCRDGEHRGLLEAGLRCPGGTLRADRRQRPPHQGGAGPQDGREGRGVDRRSGPARAGARQLRAAAGDPRAARPGAAAPVAVGGADDGAQPHAQAARDGQHQARQRRQRGIRRLRHGDAAGAGRERRHPGADGGSGAGASCAASSRRWRGRSRGA